MREMLKQKIKRGLAVGLALAMLGNVFSEHFVDAQASAAKQEATVSGNALPAVQTAGVTPLYATEQDGFTVSGFTVKDAETGELITDTVYNGQKVKVGFEWQLADDERLENYDENNFPGKTYTIDTNDPAFAFEGLSMDLSIGSESNRQPLHYQDNIVGNYYMKDGVIYITITDGEFYQNKTGRIGGISFTATISGSSDPSDDGKKKPIKFGEYSAEPKYYFSQTPSSVSLNKQISGGVIVQDGKIYQRYQVTVTAYNGTVSQLQLKDSADPEGTLTNAKDIVVLGTDPLAGTYDSLQSLFDEIEKSTLYKDETFTFEYTMEIDRDLYEESGWDHIQNKISGKYIDNRGNERNDAECSAWKTLQKPSIQKSGTGDVEENDKKYVEWTVTVNLGDYFDPSKTDLGEYLASITDKPGNGLAQNGEDIAIDPAAFTHNGNGEYTYTYRTEVTDAVRESLTDETVINRVEMTTKSGKVYNANASYTIKGGAAQIVKSVDSSEKIDGKTYVTWNIEVSNFPEDIKDFVVQDSTPHWHSTGSDHKPIGYVEVDGNVVYDESGMTAAAEGVIRDVYGWEYRALTVRFDDEYVNAAAADHRAIRLKVKTLIEQNTAGKIYENTATAEYKNKITSSLTNVGSAKAEFVDTESLLEKSGEKIYGKNAIKYRAKVYVPTLNIDSPGKSFVFEDILPVGMVLDDSVPVRAFLHDNIYGVHGDELGVVQSNLGTVSVEGGTAKKVRFSVAVTDDFLSIMEQNPNDYLYIEYAAKVEDARQFIADGKEVQFTNTISGTYDGHSIGSDSAAVTIEPEKVINKAAVYDKNTAPYVKYTVEVNPEGINLSDAGTKLTLEDELGSALKFVDFTKPGEESHKIKVQKKTDWQYLDDSEYECSFSAGRRNMKLELPDGMPLIVTYYAVMILDPGSALSEANSYNRVSLSGYTSDVTKDKTSQKGQAHEYSGWVRSDTGSIVIYKFWNDPESGQTALENSVFRLDSVDLASGTTTNVGDEFRITDANRYDANKIMVEGLLVNQVYALYEVSADDGFAVRREPYYFIIKASTIDVPSYVHRYDEEVNLINFENVKAGKLRLEKTVQGDVTQDEAETSVTFVVKDSDDREVGTYHLNDPEVTYDEASKKWTLEIDGLYPDTYLVEETTYNTASHEAVKIVYSTDGGNTWSSAADDAKNTWANVKVESEQTSNILFQNTYDEEIPENKAKIRITKKFADATGALTWEDIREKISFKICDEAGTEITAISPVAGSSLTKKGNIYESDWITLDSATAPAALNYTVEEVYTDIPNYNLSVAYTIGGIPGDKNGSTAKTADGDIALSDRAEATVNFVNTYQYTGTFPVKVSKRAVGGSERLAGAEFTLSGTRTDGGAFADISFTTTAADFEQELYPGNYLLTETKAPKGYGKMDPVSFTVRGDGMIVTTAEQSNKTLILRDKPILLKLKKVDAAALQGITGADIGIFDADKIDAGGRPLPGATPIERLTSGKNSVLTFGSLLETGKNYAIVEIEAPVGYELASSIRFSVGEDGEINYAGPAPDHDPEAADVVLMKDTESSTPTGSLYIQKTFTETLKNGITPLTWDDIKDKISFKITTGDHEIAVSKISGSQLTLTGGKYQYGPINVPAGQSYVVEEIWEPGEDDPLGSYKIVTAYSVDPGVAGDGEKTGAISIADGDSITVAYSNAYEYDGAYAVKISKYAVGGSSEIPGAGLRVTGTADGKGPIAAIEWETGTEKQIELYPGTYTLKETHVPRGYKKAADIPFAVGQDGKLTVDGDEAAKIIMRDEPIRLSVNKVLDTNPAMEIVGARIGLYKKADLTGAGRPKPEAVPVAAWMSASSDKFAFGDKLEAGESYAIVEIQAPYGYEMADNIYFNVSASGEIQMVTTGVDTDASGALLMKDAVKEEKLAKLAIEKNISVLPAQGIAQLTWNDIKDTITFEIWDENGEEIPGSPIAAASFTKVGTAYVSKNLTISAEHTYTVTEKSSLTGYNVTTSYTVTKSGGSTLQSAAGITTGTIAPQKDDTLIVTYRNTYEYNGSYPVKISKYAVGGSSEIAGATLRITGTLKTGGAIEPISWESGEQKQVDLYPGTYTLEETQAPDGYGKAAPIPFVVASDGTLTVDGNAADKIILRDAPITLSLNKVLAANTAQEIAGARIGIYRREDVGGNGRPLSGKTAVETWTSKSNEKASFGSRLQAGSGYAIVEISAPNGYELADTIYFDITDEGAVNFAQAVETDAAGAVLMKDAVLAEPVGSIRLTKKIAGGLSYHYPEGNIQFVVQNADTATPDFYHTYVLGETGFEWDAVGKKFVLVLTNLPIGNYRVEEKVTGSFLPAGYMYDKTSWTVQSTATKSGTGYLTDAVAVAQNAEARVDYTNSYIGTASYPEGDLIIQKSVKGKVTQNDVKNAVRFTVKENETGAVDEYTLDDFDYDETSGLYTLELGSMEVGSYTVTETKNSVKGMSCSVKYTIDSGKSKSGKTAKVSVEDGDTTKVVFENTYKKSSSGGSGGGGGSSRSGGASDSSGSSSGSSRGAGALASVVQTGDGSNVIFWMLLWLAALGGMFVSGRELARRKGWID